MSVKVGLWASSGRDFGLYCAVGPSHPRVIVMSSFSLVTWLQIAMTIGLVSAPVILWYVQDWQRKHDERKAKRLIHS
jgi:hypothetical protein